MTRKVSPAKRAIANTGQPDKVANFKRKIEDITEAEPHIVDGDEQPQSN